MDSEEELEELNLIKEFLDRLDALDNEEEGKVLDKGESIAKHINDERHNDTYRQNLSNLGGINIIPSNHRGACYEYLIILIGKKDYRNCEKRILEAIEHMHVKCRGKTYTVVFYAYCWDVAAWNKHRDSVLCEGCKAFKKEPHQELRQIY